jgi:predicted NBD/HSP70 family sugar kinase
MDHQFNPDSLISPSFLRQSNFATASHNERCILDFIRRNEVVTRPAITEETGLTKQSISRLVNDLLNRGLVRTGGTVNSGFGKPSTEIELVPNATYSLGASVMTDAISLALLNFRGDVLTEKRMLTEQLKRADVTDWIDQNLPLICEEHKIEKEQIFGLGVAISGFFTGQNRQLNTPGLLEDWALQDLDETLAKHFRLPVWIENDANAAAIGESMLGTGRTAKHFAYLFFLSGFGGGLVIDGKPMRGSHGNAGEFSLFLKAADLPRPGLKGLHKILVKQGVKVDSVADLVSNYDPNWPGIDKWIEKVAPSLTLLANAITAINDPEAIVLGGLIPVDLSRRLIPHIKLTNAERRDTPMPQPRLVTAEISGEATAAIGAAMLPLKKHFFL